MGSEKTSRSWLGEVATTSPAPGSLVTSCEWPRTADAIGPTKVRPRTTAQAATIAVRRVDTGVASGAPTAGSEREPDPDQPGHETGGTQEQGDRHLRRRVLPGLGVRHEICLGRKDHRELALRDGLDLVEPGRARGEGLIDRRALDRPRQVERVGTCGRRDEDRLVRTR